MYAHKLDRNSWHFKLAKSTGAIKTYTIGDEIFLSGRYSVCQYVRNIILTILFLVVASTMALAVVFTLAYPWFVAFGIGFLEGGLHVNIMAIGIMIQGTVACFFVTCWLGRGISALYSYMVPKMPKPPKDNFMTHAKAVYKQKFCYDLE